MKKRDMLKALRSGKYRQTWGVVARPLDVFGPGQRESYCCIGAMAEANGTLGTTRETPIAFGTLGLEETRPLSERGVEYLKSRVPRKTLSTGLSKPSLYGVLVSLNDTEGWTFGQIADFLEVELPEDEEELSPV